jgi:hypothetical protein
LLEDYAPQPGSMKGARSFVGAPALDWVVGLGSWVLGLALLLARKSAKPSPILILAVGAWLLAVLGLGS